MRFWDASALVPLVIEEAGTALARGWLAQDPHIVTWAMTSTELASAIERRARAGLLDPATRRAALETIDQLSERWDEVTDVFAVRARARALLARHALRAADAAQLGAALLFHQDVVSGAPLVSLDRGLAAAAEREGFRPLTWPDEPR